MAVSKTKAIEQWQIKKLWAISKALGMDKDDLYATANVSSLHSLTYIQADEVITRLEKLQGGNRPTKQKNTPKREQVAGMVTNAQSDKIWALMYELKKFDKEPVEISLGKRVSGIMAKELNITASEKDPFKWLTFADAGKLIEIIKKYVANAKKKGGGCK